MSFLQDVIAVFKKRNLPFVEKYKETEDVYTFVFEKEEGLTWKAGQHGLFTIAHKKIKNGTKPFTIASAPSENVIKITTHIGEDPSEFKVALLELEQGMTITMSGPLGSFYLKEETPSILIAGGVGITPFRSMLKQVETEANGVRKPIHLLYMDSKKSYLFREELQNIAKNTSLNIEFLDSRDQLTEKLDKLISTNKDSANYFLAGPKSMVDSISNSLQSKQVSKRNIKKDAFFGY